MDKNTKIVPITLIINMNVEQIYFLRRKKFEFNINNHSKSLIEKIKWIETELENWEQNLELIQNLWKMNMDNCKV